MAKLKMKSAKATHLVEILNYFIVMCWILLKDCDALNIGEKRGKSGQVCDVFFGILK